MLSLVKMGEGLAKRLGMTSLPERNGVLIVVDPAHRKLTGGLKHGTETVGRALAELFPRTPVV